MLFEWRTWEIPAVAETVDGNACALSCMCSRRVVGRERRRRRHRRLFYGLPFGLEYDLFQCHYAQTE